MPQSKLDSFVSSALKNVGIEEQIGYKIDVPPRREFGDFSTNAAIIAGKKLSRNPLDVAEEIVAALQKIDNLKLIRELKTVKPGFINIFLNDAYIQQSVLEIHKQDHAWGKGDDYKGQKILLEFVSANPTGPLHVGHGRWAVIGDIIGNLFKAVEYSVTKEFYVNNVGNQIEMLIKSIEAAKAGKPTPEGGYGGVYIRDISDKLKEQSSKIKTSGEIIKDIINQQKHVLSNLGIEFDSWFLESQLHEGNKIFAAVQILHDLGKTFEEGGAIWFKSQETGDDKNRVLIREDGRPTYFAADIAYHLDKYNRGFDQIINIWGTDHHGYVGRLKGAIGALGLPVEKFNIIIGQLVTLYRGDEPVRMSKRTGEMVTLQEVIDEIGCDATRFFFAATDVNSHLDFDLELAKKQSNDNPVFYVQYAHARICSILKKSQSLNPKSEQGDIISNLNDPAERRLMLKLLAWPETVKLAAKLRHPHRICEYGKELATEFHHFYEKCRVLGNSARLVLVDASRITLRNVLELLGVTAPESM
ncbi:MAG: arginine--tRNA ligase [Candidatus Margulisbacteria bacterium]|nr:arginine--tRNA ligase [Candidatus Margulisiibacteriota bacterium]